MSVDGSVPQALMLSVLSQPERLQTGEPTTQRTQETCVSSASGNVTGELHSPFPTTNVAAKLISGARSLAHTQPPPSTARTMRDPITLPPELTHKIIGLAVGPLSEYEKGKAAPRARKALLKSLRHLSRAWYLATQPLWWEEVAFFKAQTGGDIARYLQESAMHV